LSGASSADEHENEMDVSIHVAADIKWKDGPASLPKGAKLAVLEGDPSQEAPFVMRVMLPDGDRIPPHTHPKPERVTVISGVFNLGMGSKFDVKNTKATPSGTFGVRAPGIKHYVWWIIR